LTTTIQVEDSTIEVLKRIKKRENATSYDETIRKLLNNTVKGSMAGALARKKNYSKTELLKGLRDERDRI